MIDLVRFENQCVNCGLPCEGIDCKYSNVKVLECDECKCECDKLYIGISERELCGECALKELEVIE